MDNETTFIDGVIWSAQFMAINHREDGFAEDILRHSDFTRKQLMASQRKSGYESRVMYKLIRRATPNVTGQGTRHLVEGTLDPIVGLTFYRFVLSIKERTSAIIAIQ